MMPIDRFEQDLRVWFQDGAGTTPSGLHERAIDEARRARQRTRWLAAFHRGAPAGWAVVSGLGGAALWTLIAFGLVVGILAAAAVGGQLTHDLKHPPGAVTSTPMPTTRRS